MRRMRACVVVSAVAATLAAALPSSAAATPPITSVFAGQTVSGTAISCATQTDGTRVCTGSDGGGGGIDTRLKSFDGTPLALYVTLPPAPSSSGTDGRYPVVVQSHGWDTIPSGPNDTQYYGPTADTWAKNGYAVLQLVARGWGDSCGSAESRLLDPTGCANGYLRLDDERYEARDVQYALGLLVDEGVVDPNRIGVTGESYGGGVSLELATLNNRVMNANGSLSPWTSPAGVPLHIAASAPVIPWSDLVYSLLPNGHTLDYDIAGPTTDLSPIGVDKDSFVDGLYAEGNESGYYAPSGLNSQADLTSWFAAINAGEPYDSNPEDQAVVSQIAQYHSAYYLLDGAYGTAKTAPAPLLIANGFTDDLFPVDEALRYYNLDQSLYPNNPIGLFDGDFGHQAAQNKPGDKALLSSRIQAFFDHYVKGTGATPTLGATATIETCPSTTPSGGPFTAASWSALHPGEVDYTATGTQTVLSGSGDPTISQTIDPITGKGACATVSGSDQGTGVATYRLPTVTGNGYTLLGSPTVIANLNVTGQYAYIAARLWDVDTSTNTETLVARGVYRIDSSLPDGLQVFQLHPGAWHFAAGHVPKLELLGEDAPYLRPSNGTFAITLSNLQLRLPVHDVPGAPGVPSIVTKPLPHVQPHPVAATTCSSRPTSRIAKRRTHASHKRLFVTGTALGGRCASISAATRRRESLKHVYVIVYRSAGHGRCQFLERNGHVSKARRCSNPIELRARGTSKWKLRLSITVPPGRWFIRSDAVNRAGQHQRRSAAARTKVHVR